MRDGQSQVCEQSHLDRRSLGRRSNHPEGASECPEVMLWTAPPRHESAIEVGAVRTSHDPGVARGKIAPHRWAGGHSA
jgi:hypothetical protein